MAQPRGADRLQKISKRKEIPFMNPKIYIGYLFAFISGLTLGALTALLLAPTSGEELRGQIRVKADASGQQIKTNVGQARQWVTDETGKLRKSQPGGQAPDIQ
jgi:hypothetical protein